VDERTAVFIISVAARLVAMHPSTLRKYEDCGLLEPCRQGGRLRLYSLEDIARLHQIRTLVEGQGINLAGVKLALRLTDQAHSLRELVEDSGDLGDRRHEIQQLTDKMLALLGANVPKNATRATPRAESAATK